MELIEILNINVEDLREKLIALNLPSEGNKAELQKNLINHFHSTRLTEEVYDDAESIPSFSASNTSTHFSFRDIEESIEFFSGEQETNVSKWIEDFELTSRTVGWNEIQKFIYAKIDERISKNVC